MQQKKTNRAETRKNAAAKANGRTTTTETRADRWRAHIEKEIKGIKGNPHFCPVEFIEEVEGTDIVSTVLAGICARRGFGVADNPNDWTSKLNRDSDDAAEKMPVRSRNAHEKEIAVFNTHGHLALYSVTSKLTRKELRAFVRAFYRKGDFGLQPAVDRAVQCAVGIAVGTRTVYAVPPTFEKTLARAADAMNGVAWCCTDNTPKTVFEEFVRPMIDELEDPAELSRAICETIETGAEDGTEENARRIEELADALATEFGTRQRQAEIENAVARAIGSDLV